MAIAAPAARRSLIGSAIAAFQARAQRRTGRPSRVVAAVQANVMTFAGLAAIDFAFFHMGHFAGLLSTGVSFLLADFKLQG